MLTSALNVLVTMRFNEAQLDRLRQVSPDVRVTRDDPAGADYSHTDVLYAGAPPRDLGRAPNLKWVQLHMAGVDALAEHPLYTQSAIPLVTASGVHAATIAEYAITMLLALAHRVPRMVEWQGRGAWPPPHVSGFLPSYDDKCTDLFAENLRRYLGGAPLLNMVERARGY